MMLSVETSGETAAEQEVNVSLGNYVPAEEVMQAFGLKALAKPWSVAPNQPTPVDKRVYATWIGWIILIVLANVMFSALFSRRVDQGFFVMALVLVSIVPLGTWLYGRDFEKRRWQDSEFNPYETEE